MRLFPNCGTLIGTSVPTQERPLGSPNSTVTIKVGQHNVDIRLGPDGMPAPGEMIFSVPGPAQARMVHLAELSASQMSVKQTRMAKH